MALDKKALHIHEVLIQGSHNPFIGRKTMSVLFLDQITTCSCPHLPPLSCQRIPMWFAYLLFQDTHTNELQVS